MCLNVENINREKEAIAIKGTAVKTFVCHGKVEMKNTIISLIKWILNYIFLYHGNQTYLQRYPSSL